MVEKAIILKVKQSSNKEIIDRAIESLKNKSSKYYNLNDIDKDIFCGEILEKERFIFVMVLYKEISEKRKIKIDALLMGHGTFNEKNNIEYTMHKSTTSELFIGNFTSNSEIDINEDFQKQSYLMISHSKILIEQLEFYMSGPYNSIQSSKKTYSNNYINIELSDLAQHNKDCKRIIGVLPEQDGRSEFQRDRERIVNSKAFRRLVDKAQIFTSSKGDHYRTRMTHTLEVSQISRAISSELNLNTDLTEAIALAHDIGHTPFGHQGERTLDNILKNTHKIINIPEDLKENFKNEIGGFKHNYQGIRVLTSLEEKYIEFLGLDISTQVLEGVLKHTKLKMKNCETSCINNCNQDCYNIYDFVNEEHAKNLYLDYEYASTLEGQVVFIADEIAQRGHDVDDAFLSGLLSIEEFLDYLKVKSMKQLEIKVIDLYKEINDVKRPIIDRQSLIRARVISTIVNFFINDVLTASKKNINEYKSNNDITNKIFDKLLITSTSEGKRANNYLEKIISKKAINSSEVSKFDYNAESVIINLFKSYYDNPKLLSNDCLRKIYIDFKNSPNKDVSNNIIDFKNGDFKLVKEELKNISHLKISRVIYSDNESLTEDEKKQKATNIEYWEKRKILVRNIADYIAGMTDNYAINEYNSIHHKDGHNY